MLMKITIEIKCSHSDLFILYHGNGDRNFCYHRNALKISMMLSETPSMAAELIRFVFPSYSSAPEKSSSIWSGHRCDRLHSGLYRTYTKIDPSGAAPFRVAEIGCRAEGWEPGVS
jgi:hypothetical protein